MDRRRMTRRALQAFRGALFNGLALMAAGVALLVGSLAHFLRGNLFTGLVIVAMAGFWIVSGGLLLAWRRRRLRSPRRSDWEEERRRDTAIH